jgi:hypothetical protein
VADRAIRVLAVDESEGLITTDTQERVIEETLDGPALRTSCAPVGGGSTDGLMALILDLLMPMQHRATTGPQRP